MADKKIQDFAVEQDNSGLFDLVIDKDLKDFKSVSGMETAINTQLFINQRVSKEEAAIPANREGWIGDMQTRDEAYQIGSLIFLKNQSRNTFLDNNETAAYAKEALEYFTAIGASKEITSRVVGKNIEGTITNDDNSISRYNGLWRATVTDGK